MEMFELSYMHIQHYSFACCMDFKQINLACGNVEAV